MAVVGSCEVRTNSLDRAYAQVRVGDTKDSVVAALGEPSQIESWLGSANEKTVEARASEIIRYYTLTHSWWFFIDTGGKVQSKGHKFRF